jgi:hypothetical protein
MRGTDIETVWELLDALEGCGDAGIEVVVKSTDGDIPCKCTLHNCLKVPDADFGNIRTIRFECEAVDEEE